MKDENKIKFKGKYYTEKQIDNLPIIDVQQEIIRITKDNFKNGKVEDLPFVCYIFEQFKKLKLLNVWRKLR